MVWFSKVGSQLTVVNILMIMVVKPFRSGLAVVRLSGPSQQVSSRDIGKGGLYLALT